MANPYSFKQPNARAATPLSEEEKKKFGEAPDVTEPIDSTKPATTTVAEPITNPSNPPTTPEPINPTSSFSAEQVNQRAQQYAQPLDAQKAQYAQMLKDQLRSTFNAGRGQVSGAVNAQAADAARRNVLDQNVLASQEFQRAQNLANQDVSGIFNLQNQLGHSTWQTMNQNAQQQWLAQQQIAAQAQAAAVENAFREKLLGSQQLHEQSLANQANRQQIVSNFFAPIIATLLKNGVTSDDPNFQKYLKDAYEQGMASGQLPAEQ